MGSVHNNVFVELSFVTL